MRQYQQARVWTQIKYSFASIIFLIILTVIVIRQDLRLFDKYYKISNVRDDAQAELDKSQNVNRISALKYESIKTERGIEGYVRQAYPVVKDGESVITLYNATSSNISTVELEPSAMEKFSKWLSEVYNNAIIDYTNNRK